MSTVPPPALDAAAAQIAKLRRESGGPRETDFRWATAILLAAMPYLMGDGDNLLTPREVAALCRVQPRTVYKWNLPSVLTPGGHRRYRASDVSAYIAGAGGNGS